jgi:hypothetical protein
MIHAWRGLRIADQVSNLLIVVALVITFAGLGRAQSSDQSQFNGRIDATVSAMDKRIDRLESALNYAVGALVMNLVAHLFQISTQLRRRRDQDDEPRVREH